MRYAHQSGRGENRRLRQRLHRHVGPGGGDSEVEGRRGKVSQTPKRHVLRRDV